MDDDVPNENNQFDQTKLNNQVKFNDQINPKANQPSNQILSDNQESIEKIFNNQRPIDQKLAFLNLTLKQMLLKTKEKEMVFKEYKLKYFQYLFVPSSIGFVSFKLVQSIKNSKKLLKFTNAGQALLVYLMSKEASNHLATLKKNNEIKKDKNFQIELKEILNQSKSAGVNVAGIIKYNNDFNQKYNWFTLSCCSGFVILKLFTLKSSSLLKLSWVLAWQTMLLYLLIKEAKFPILQFKFNNDFINSIENFYKEKDSKLDKSKKEIGQTSDQISKKLYYKPTPDQQEKIKVLNSRYLKTKKE